jgi:hypothetical protein
VNRSKRLDGVANATPMVQFLVPALSTYCRRASLIPVFSWLAPPLREANRDLVLASHVRAAHLLAQAVTSVILEGYCQRQTVPGRAGGTPLDVSKLKVSLDPAPAPPQTAFLRDCPNPLPGQLQKSLPT